MGEASVRARRAASRPGERRLSATEWIVLLVVGLALVALLSPAVATLFGSSRVDRALADLEVLAVALEGARDAGGEWSFPPIAGAAAPAAKDVELLVTTDGDLPAVTVDATGWGKLSPGGVLPGPVSRDPWGRAYVCNARSLVRGAGRPVWILSAGRNGRIETPASSRTLGGDDVGLLIAR